MLSVLPPPDLRRAVPLTSCIAGFGRVFRQHPNTLTITEKTSLFASSVSSQKINAFVSHSWGSPGYQKYFCLLIYECGVPALASALVVGLLVLLLQQMVFKLPFARVEGAFDPIFTVYQESQPWEFVFSLLAGISALLFYPFYGHIRKRLYFLDCMCIHQTDLVKKTAGIHSLGGFIIMSERLYVMWDSQYFSRLWCMYELAVFKALHPNKNNVSILPLRQAVAILILIPAFTAGFLAYIILFPLVASGGIYTFYAAAFAASTLVFTGACVAGCDFAEQLVLLEKQLSDFDVRTAECFAPEDRKEILSKIEYMFLTDGLDEFNSTVRNELKHDLLNEVRPTPTTILPYQFLMVGLIASVGFMFFGISWFRSANQETFVSFTIYMITFAWACMPLITTLCMGAGERIYKAHPTPTGDTGGVISALRRNKWRYLLTGLSGAFVFIFIWTSLAFVWPLAAANSLEGDKFIGVFGKESAIWISIFTNAPCFALCWWVLRGVKSAGCLHAVEHSEDE